MLIQISHVANAQMESDEVDFVRDWRIGESPRRAKYIRSADLKVFRRTFRREENFGIVVGCGSFAAATRGDGRFGDTGEMDGTDSPEVDRECRLTIEFRLLYESCPRFAVERDNPRPRAFAFPFAFSFAEGFCSPSKEPVELTLEPSSCRVGTARLLTLFALSLAVRAAFFSFSP